MRIPAVWTSVACAACVVLASVAVVDLVESSQGYFPPLGISPFNVTDRGFVYCPGIVGPPQSTVKTCELQGYNETANSTTLVIVGANVSFNESVSTADSAGQPFALIANLTQPGTDTAIWIFSSQTSRDLDGQDVWVNVTVATRVVITAMDVEGTPPNAIEGVSPGGSGRNGSLHQNVTVSQPDSLLVMAAFDNQTRANGVCGFAGWLVNENQSVVAASSGTYRNLLVGYEPYNGTAAVAELSFQFGYVGLFSPLGGCIPNSTPFVGFLLAVDLTSS